MATFTKLNKVKSFKSATTGEIVDIYKYLKDGTKMTFFAPEVNGTRISKLVSRKWLAIDIAKEYLNRNK